MYVELDKQIYFKIFFSDEKCFKVEVYYYYIILLLEEEIAQNLPLYQNTEKLGIYSNISSLIGVMSVFLWPM